MLSMFKFYIFQSCSASDLITIMYFITRFSVKDTRLYTEGNYLTRQRTFSLQDTPNLLDTRCPSYFVYRICEEIYRQSAQRPNDGKRVKSEKPLLVWGEVEAKRFGDRFVWSQCLHADFQDILTRLPVKGSIKCGVFLSGRAGFYEFISVQKQSGREATRNPNSLQDTLFPAFQKIMPLPYQESTTKSKIKGHRTP